MLSMLSEVGSTATSQTGRDLSIAQKHLLEIAKALVLSPTLLILDEPTHRWARTASSCSSASSGRGRRWQRGRLHHAPTRRGPRPRRPGHGAAGRQAAGTSDVDAITDEQLWR
jgi:ribose transport system ATP-binding protein